MGAMRGIELVAAFIKPGNVKLAKRIELCRIAVAGRAIECDGPEFWPQRGGW